VTTAVYLYLAALLFVAGALGTLLRTSAAGRMVGVELMLAAASLTFAASAAGFRELDGQLAALIVVAAALAHAVVGSALVASLRRLR
jgi:NADH:ubiquinone oxidoreductase subunit K